MILSVVSDQEYSMPSETKPEHLKGKSTKKAGSNKNKIKKPKITRKIKGNNDDSIGKSKQLSAKTKTQRTRQPSTRAKSNTNSVKTCSNGKPMPSLAELEKMFDSSDDESLDTIAKKDTSAPPVTPGTVTPKKDVILTADKLMSPNTIKVLSNKLMEYMDSIDPNEILSNTPPPPVIPQKKHKKGNEPYIVGCMDRAQVSGKFKTIIGNPREKYGIDYNVQPDLPVEKDETEISNNIFVSKSIFNPLSAEIAAKLKEAENLEKDSVISDKSDDTVSYDFSDSPTYASFTPRPSTSKDTETIEENEKLFTKSIIPQQDENDLSDVEIIETPYETIVIDDGIKISDKESVVNCTEDSVIEIVDETPLKQENSVINLDDDIYMYKSIPSLDFSDNDCEIIDVDDLIAENNALIDKYKKHNVLGEVIDVDKTVTTQEEIIPTNNNDGNQNMEQKSEKATGAIESVMNKFFKNYSPNNSNTEMGVSSLTDMFKLFLNKATQIIQCLSPSESLRKIQQNNERPGDPRGRKRDHNCVASSSNPYRRKRPKTLIYHYTDSIEIPSTSETRPENNYLINNMVTSTPNSNVLSTNENNNPPVNPIPSNPVTETSPVRNFGDCPICLDNLANTPIASTLCGHIFCMRCIKSAFSSAGRGSKRCPSCRKVLKGVGYHQLFL